MRLKHLNTQQCTGSARKQNYAKHKTKWVVNKHTNDNIIKKLIKKRETNLIALIAH